MARHDSAMKTFGETFCVGSSQSDRQVRQLAGMLKRCNLFGSDRRAALAALSGEEMLARAIENLEKCAGEVCVVVRSLLFCW